MVVRKRQGLDLEGFPARHTPVKFEIAALFQVQLGLYWGLAVGLKQQFV